MKTIRTILLIMGVAARSSFAGTDPTNSTQLFQMESATLDPDTFAVTLVISTPRNDLFYGVQAHDGPYASNATWQALSERLGTGTTLTFIDDVSGSLTHAGKTYRGFVAEQSGAPSNSWMITANEEFIAYPFLLSPQIALEETGPANELLITYGEGIYSNHINYAPPAGQEVGFFRIFSTNNDPINASIQIQTNLVQPTWSDVP